MNLHFEVYICVCWSNVLDFVFQDISNSDLERCSPDVRIYAVKDVCNGLNLSIIIQ
jgi:hypothetical protein